MDDANTGNVAARRTFVSHAFTLFLGITEGTVNVRALGERIGVASTNAEALELNLTAPKL